MNDEELMVEQVYERFGWKMSDAFVARLEAATRKQRSFNSSHDYSLEQFGLTEASLARDFAPYRARYLS